MRLIRRIEIVKITHSPSSTKSQIINLSRETVLFIQRLCSLTAAVIETVRPNVAPHLDQTYIIIILENIK